jgi:hypothetical protein
VTIFNLSVILPPPFCVYHLKQICWFMNDGDVCKHADFECITSINTKLKWLIYQEATDFYGIITGLHISTLTGMYSFLQCSVCLLCTESSVLFIWDLIKCYLQSYLNRVLQGNIANKGNMAKWPLRNGVICVTDRLVYVAHQEDWAVNVCCNTFHLKASQQSTSSPEGRSRLWKWLM